MKALILYGSPRINGNTARILNEIVILLKEENIAYEEVYISNLDGNACIGCNYCRENAKCIFLDEYSEIIEKIMESHILVLSSPVYFGSVTSQLKKLIDRFQLLYNNAYLINKKSIYFVSTAAESNAKVFDGIKQILGYLKYIFKADICEITCINNVEEINDLEKKVSKDILKYEFTSFLNRICRNE